MAPRDANTERHQREWLKLEDIYSGLCAVRADMAGRRLHPRGAKQARLPPHNRRADGLRVPPSLRYRSRLYAERSLDVSGTAGGLGRPFPRGQELVDLLHREAEQLTGMRPRERDEILVSRGTGRG